MKEFSPFIWDIKNSIYNTKNIQMQEEIFIYKYLIAATALHQIGVWL